MTSVRRGPGPLAPAVALAVVVAVVVAGLTGCREVEQATPPVHEPAQVEQVEDGVVPRVVFDRAAVEQVSLRTATVRRAGDRLVVPYAALIYDEQGRSWVYTSPEPRAYLRAPVVVEDIEGTRVSLSRGPAVGTRVVTVGATQVYGAELGIAGGH